MTLRAAANGSIDFSKTDLHSPSWWKNWRYLTNALDEADRGELLRRSYEFQLALISNPRLEPSDFTALQRQAKDTFYDIEGSVRPWLGRTKEDRDIKEKEQYKAAWQDHFGFNPDDREARLKWEQELEQHVDATQQKREETEAQTKSVTENFNKRVEEIRQKRLRQQGRG